MSGNPEKRVFKQKAAYRYLFPTLTLCSLVAAVVTSYLIVAGQGSEAIAQICVASWLVAVLNIRPSVAVLASVAVDDESITRRTPFASGTIRFRDVTGLDIQRARQRIQIHAPQGVIYCGPTFRQIDELINMLEELVRPHLRNRERIGQVAFDNADAIPLPRTFRRSKRFRSRTYLGIVFYVCPAIVLTWFVVESYSFILLVVAAVLWLFSVFTLRDLLRLPGKLVVDANAVTYKGVFGTTRIQYDDVVEVVAMGPRDARLPYEEIVRMNLQKNSHLRVRSHWAEIGCDTNYEDPDEFIQLVVSKVPQDILEVPLSEEFRYSRSMRTLFVIMLCFFAGMVVWAVVSGITQDHADDFYSEVVFPIALFGAFALLGLYAVLEYGERVLVERGCIMSVSWRGRTTIPYDEVVSITRNRPWHGDERLMILGERNRLQISHQIERFDDLVRTLNDIVPVKWKGEDAVQFPVSVRVRRWWLEPVLGLASGSAAVVFGLYYGPQSMTSGDGPWRGIFLLVSGVGAGIFMLAYGVRYLWLRPICANFEAHEFVVSGCFGTRRYAAEQVERIDLREEHEKGSVTRSVEIDVDGRRYVFSDSGISVSIVPLYELLCKTYWPEGYREPGVTLNRTRADADCGPSGADSAGE